MSNSWEEIKAESEQLLISFVEEAKALHDLVQIGPGQVQMTPKGHLRATNTLFDTLLVASDLENRGLSEPEIDQIISLVDHLKTNITKHREKHL